MNNLWELNSKWYWRLIKVLGALLYLIILLYSSVWIIGDNSHYRPEKLESAKKIIEDSSTITNLLRNISETLTGQKIDIKDLRKLISKEYINDPKTVAKYLVMIEFLWKKLERVEVCWRKVQQLETWCSNRVWNYIDMVIDDEKREMFTTLNKYTYQSTKEEFDRYYWIEKNTLEKINNLTDWSSDWESFAEFNTHYQIDINEIIWRQRNEYRSFNDYIKIILYILRNILGILLFNFLLTRVIYYIVLGKFFPNKKLIKE